MNKNNIITFLPRWVIILHLISVLFIVLILTLGEGKLVPFYYIAMTGIGLYILKREQKVKYFLQKIPLSGYIKFILLGYFAVIAEEIIVGLIYTLQEGFSFSLLAVRIFQFVSFNVVAFTALILAASILMRKIKYRPVDIFLIWGGWGLFSEGVLFIWSVSPISLLLLLIPTMVVYSIIILPAYLSMKTEEKGSKEVSFLVRLVITWLVILLFSVIPLYGLDIARSKYPSVFPACEYVRC